MSHDWTLIAADGRARTVQESLIHMAYRIINISCNGNRKSYCRLINFSSLTREQMTIGPSLELGLLYHVSGSKQLVSYHVELTAINNKLFGCSYAFIIGTPFEPPLVDLLLKHTMGGGNYSMGRYEGSQL